MTTADMLESLPIVEAAMAVTSAALTSESREMEVTLMKVPSMVWGLVNFSSAWH